MTLLGFLAGISGALYAQFQEFIATSVIDGMMSTNVLFMAYIGGIGYFWGPIIGSGIFVYLSEYLSSFTDRWELILGLIFIAVVLFAPQGIMGIIRKKKVREESHGRSGREIGKHILELQDIYKDFDGLEVLFGINLGIQEGERHAIIGPNGAGKSTIFNLITGKYLPSKGKIFFKGQDVTGTSPFKLNRQGLARSFQITNIFRTMTVFQNVRNAVLSRNKIRLQPVLPSGSMEDINGQTEKVLEQIGLLERKDIIAGLLSYGQQRALEIGLTIATIRI